jgi:hypothetical protein
MHVVKRHMIGVVFNLLAEGVRKTGEAPHVHPHREILALHVRRADVVWIGVSLDWFRLAADAFCGAIARLLLA